MDPNQNVKSVLNKFRNGRNGLRTSDGKTKDRVEDWRKNIQSLNSDLLKQLDIMQNFQTSNQLQQGNPQIEKKQFFQFLVSQLGKEIQQIVNIAKLVLHLPKKFESKDETQRYQQGWKEISDWLKTEMTTILQESQKKEAEPLLLVTKLFNLKQNMLLQVIKGLLYKKVLLWMDLNIHTNEFVHTDIVKMIDQINKFKQSLGYIPTKLSYNEVNLETPGIYLQFGEDSHSQTSQMLNTMHALTESFIDMEGLIKNCFALSKRQKLSNDNPVQTTLRQQLQSAFKQQARLQERIHELQNLLRVSSERKELVEMSNKIQKLKKECENKDKQIQYQKVTLKNMEGANLQLKGKQRRSQQQLNRLRSWFVPKLQQARKVQGEVLGELKYIRQDAALLPAMFRQQAVFRTNCMKDKDRAQQKMKVAVKQAMYQKNEKNDMKHELERKQRLAMQAIAARSSMKEQLKAYQQEIKNLKESNQNLTLARQEADNQSQVYQQRYNELYASVSNLNKRIQELETQKLKLLEKLQSLGDKTDLDYISKSMGGQQQ